MYLKIALSPNSCNSCNLFPEVLF